MWSCIWFLFFFQAEDGIRDDLVTGVQTCALPISPLACVFATKGTPEEASVAPARSPSICEALTVVASGMSPAPDVLSFEVSAGPSDAAPAEAFTDWTSGPAFRQPAQSAVASSESSKRAEVRLTPTPHRVMLTRPHHNVRSSARAIIGAFTLQVV